MESQRQVVDTSVNNNTKKGLTKDEEINIEASEKLEVVKSFDDMGLREELLRGKLVILLF